MATSQAWRLKRYGRCIEDSTGRMLWKIFDLNDNGQEMFLTIVTSGYLLVMRGQESLDTIPFLSGFDPVKVQQKSENLIFRCTMNGESRIMRMQFDGIEECASAVETLKEYVSVTTQDGTPSPPNQPPAEASAPVTQNCQGKPMEVDPEVVRGSLSIKHLTQHILGETVVTLPQVYRHASLAQGDLEPILRVCLLDPSFPAFVEKVEEELRKLLED